MFKTFLFILSIFIGSMACGQDMLIEQIAGKEVVRKAFNAEKELISKQVFKVGELQTKGNKLTVELQVTLFDEDGKLKEKYYTQYTCKPDKSDVLITVFPFARKNDAEYVIGTSSTNFKNLYDFKPGEKTLEDLSMEMSIESGVLSFFGSKNLLILTDRNLSLNEDGFTLKSTLTIESYLWGVKVKTISYQLTEKLDKNRSLLNQKFNNEGDSYFLMNY